MYQKVTLLGNVGRDSEMRYTPQGKAVTNFSVATTNAYMGADGQKVKETTWWTVAVFGKLAEVCAQYVKKGNTVYIEGRMDSDKTTGGPKLFPKKDGTQGAKFELIGDVVRFVGGSHESKKEEETDDEAVAF